MIIIDLQTNGKIGNDQTDNDMEGSFYHEKDKNPPGAISDNSHCIVWNL